jgi:hypothetical protein
MAEPFAALTHLSSLTLNPKREKKPLTTLARKYAHPVARRGSPTNPSHRVLKNTGKSGLTPLSPFLAYSNSLYKTFAEERFKRRLYQYQRSRYYGFTAAELRDMQAMSALVGDGVRGALANPVRPLFERGKWDTEASLHRHLSFLPILEGKGEGGLWTVENELVWKVLEGPVRLASLLLREGSSWSWYVLTFLVRSVNTMKE